MTPTTNEIASNKIAYFFVLRKTSVAESSLCNHMGRIVSCFNCCLTHFLQSDLHKNFKVSFNAMAFSLRSSSSFSNSSILNLIISAVFEKGDLKFCEFVHYKVTFV